MSIKQVVTAMVGLVGVLVIGVLVVFTFFKRSETVKERYHIVSSMYPIAYFTQRIVGERALVSTVTPAGVEPHEYEPTTQDVAMLEDGDLILIYGTGIEPWQDAALQYGEKTVTLYPAASNHDVMHGWLSPRQASHEVDAIAQAVKSRAGVALDSQDVDQRARTLRLELDKLQQEAEQQLNTCKQKKIITTHAAFGTMVSELGFEQEAVMGATPDEEPSPQRIAEVVALMREQHIRYVFAEPLLGSRVAETIAAETGASILTLDPLEAPSAAQLAAGEDYFSIQRANIQNLALALECTQ